MLCQAALENTLVEEVENAKFPIEICSSSEDELVTIKNLPNFTANPKLSNVTVLGSTASGNHGGASAFCLLGSIFRFTSLGNIGVPLLNGIAELPPDSGVSCNPDSFETVDPVPSDPPVDSPSASPSIRATITPTLSPTSSGTSSVSKPSMPADNPASSSPLRSLQLLATVALVTTISVLY